MINFEYTKAPSTSAAIKARSSFAASQFIAGGTNLVDLMKRGVMVPERLIDITGLPLKDLGDGPAGLTIGALVPNSTVAEHPMVKSKYPLLAMALNAGASAQLRNMATMGGNIMQRTRCPYFYDTTMPCNKRSAGSGCSAMEGYNRMHAIFGASEACIAVHPSDMCVALAALDAVVHTSGPKGDRKIAFTDFHRLPGDTPMQDNNLATGELITAIQVPAHRFNKTYYLKVRDRLSYAFALVSVAVALEVNGGTIQAARLAMGGVAHKPWRLQAAEQLLVGKAATQANFAAAAELAMEGAKTYQHNGYKVKLGKAAIIEALTKAMG